MSERVPAWAESDERYPEREAEWRAAIARAERAEAGLAALRSASVDYQRAIDRYAGDDYHTTGRRHPRLALDAALADTAAAAEAYRASVEAPLRAEATRAVLAATAESYEARRAAEAERDTLAAALAEVREAARVVTAHARYSEVTYASCVELDRALTALPADLAADAFRRARAEALDAAADAIERGSVLSQYGAHGWLRARAADERGGR